MIKLDTMEVVQVIEDARMDQGVIRRAIIEKAYHADIRANLNDLRSKMITQIRRLEFQERAQAPGIVKDKLNREIDREYDRLRGVDYADQAITAEIDEIPF